MRDFVSVTSAGRLVAQARKRGDLRLLGSGVQVHGGLLHLELLLGHAEIDLALLALDAADDLLLGGLQPRFFDVVPGVGEIGGVLLRGNPGLGQLLVERGLGLLQRRLLLLQRLLGAAGVEADNWLALLHPFARRRQPGDPQVGDDGCVDLDRAAGPQLPAAADDDHEIAVPRGRQRQADLRFDLPQPVHPGRRAAEA